MRSSNKSKPKRTVTPYYMYMSALPLPIGAFGISIDIAKIRLLHDNVSCFDEKFIGMKQNSSIAHENKTRDNILWNDVEFQRISQP